MRWPLPWRTCTPLRPGVTPSHQVPHTHHKKGKCHTFNIFTLKPKFHHVKYIVTVYFVKVDWPLSYGSPKVNLKDFN